MHFTHSMNFQSLHLLMVYTSNDHINNGYPIRAKSLS